MRVQIHNKYEGLNITFDSIELEKITTTKSKKGNIVYYDGIKLIECGDRALNFFLSELGSAANYGGGKREIFADHIAADYK